jgi:hypothetical protein
VRWRVRKADIDAELRATFEQYGVAVMQQILAAGNNFRYQDRGVWVEVHRDALLKWLTEQYDRQEAKEGATFAMELAITLLVASELFFSVLNYLGCTPPGK